MPGRYIVGCDCLIFANICGTFSELPLWKICIPRIVQAEEILIGCFVECQSIKKVGGRRSVEELYQALWSLIAGLKKLANNDPFNYWCQFFLFSFAYYLSTVCKLANVILSTVSCIS